MQDIYTILIVDDQRTNLLLLEAIIESNFYHRVIKATDAKSALDIVGKEQIDLIISDIEMPQMNGYEFAKELKKSNDTKDIPIMLASSLERNNQNEMKAYESGAIDFIAKPINHAVFILKLKSYFNMMAMQYDVRRRSFLIS